MAELLTLYRQNDTPPPLDYEMLSDYEGIRSNIACKLIHAASNEAILKDVPYIPWMDLAIVFYLCIHEDDSGLMTAMIHNSHLRIWNISLEDLKTSALANSPRLFPPVISSMACIIEEMNRGLNPHFQETHPKPETPAPFYVLSNRSGINGAACILYEDVLKNFADGVEKNLIILPSSIHEVLLLPDDGDISYEEPPGLLYLKMLWYYSLFYFVIHNIQHFLSNSLSLPITRILISADCSQLFRPRAFNIIYIYEIILFP